MWASTKAFVGLQSSLDDSWEVDVDDRDGLPAQRAKALMGLTIVVISQIGTLTLSAIVSAADLPAFSNLGIVGATVVINIVVIAAMYRFLTSYPTTWRDVWLGAVFAGLAYTALQHFGTPHRPSDSPTPKTRRRRRSTRSSASSHGSASSESP